MNLEGTTPASLAITQLWQLTIVIVAIALIARLACRQRPHLAHLLWMLVLVKAVVPPVFSSDWAVLEWVRWPVFVSPAESTHGPLVLLGDPPLPSATVRPITQPTDGTTAAGLADQDADFDGPREPVAAALGSLGNRSGSVSRMHATTILVTLWLVGALATAVLVTAKLALFYRSVRRRSVSDERALQDVVEQLRRRLGISRRVSLIVSTHAHVPTACGFWHARIVVSQD